MDIPSPLAHTRCWPFAVPPTLPPSCLPPAAAALKTPWAAGKMLGVCGVGVGVAGGASKDAALAGSCRGGGRPLQEAAVDVVAAAAAAAAAAASASMTMIASDNHSADADIVVVAAAAAAVEAAVLGGEAVVRLLGSVVELEKRRRVNWSRQTLDGASSSKLPPALTTAFRRSCDRQASREDQATRRKSARAIQRRRSAFFVCWPCSRGGSFMHRAGRQLTLPESSQWNERLPQLRRRRLLS